MSSNGQSYSAKKYDLARSPAKNIVPDKGDMSVIKIPVGISLKEAEKEIIQKTLQMTRGSKKEAANILGISSRKIEYKVKEWQ